MALQHIHNVGRPAKLPLDLVSLANPRTLLSNNVRLENTFHLHPEYVNRELTFPCKINSEPLYLSPNLEAESQAALRRHARTIILPHQFAQLTDNQRKKVLTLASPYECGRVLEADTTIKVGNDTLVLTVKGVGCTKFFRDTGAENKWMLPIHRSFGDTERCALAKLPFYKHWGLMHSQYALDQVHNSLALSQKNVDAEKVLAVYRIDAMLDEHGMMKPIAYLKDHNLIDSNVDPVLIFRGVRTNLRLLDVIMLDELKKGTSIQAMIESILPIYQSLSGDQSPTIPKYLAWLCRKVIRQELPLILAGYEMSSGFWQDLARNISLLGQELDLEDVAPSKYRLASPFEYFNRVSRSFHNIETSLAIMCDRVLTHCGESIDAITLVDIVWQEIRDALKERSLESYFNKHNTKEWKHHNLSFKEFVYYTFKALGAPYLDFISCNRNNELITYHETLRIRFANALGLRLHS